MNKMILSLLLMMGVGVTHAANVAWNCFGCSFNESGYFEIAARVGELWPSACGEYTITPEGVNLSATFYYMEFYGGSYLASYGEIVGPSTALGRPAYFNNNFDWEADHKVYDILIPDNDDVYLAFAIELFDPTTWDNRSGEYCYGWVALHNYHDRYGSSISVTASAIDLDGNPMYVGGGSILPEGSPEPSCVLMMLLGVATLGLRRRWRMENVKWKM